MLTQTQKNKATERILRRSRRWARRHGSRSLGRHDAKQGLVI